MSQKKITEEFLEKEVWWWKPGAKKHPVDFEKNPLDLRPAPLLPVYYLAFNYELARRVYRTRRLAPFPALTASHLFIISELGDRPTKEPECRDASTNEHEIAKGWTRPKRQWNLKLSDNALVKAFFNFIQQERTAQGISAPRPNAGQRNRPISWRWLELMDLAEFKIRSLEDNERSSLSVARKTALAKLKIFDNCIDEYWKRAVPLDEEELYSDPADPYSRCNDPLMDMFLASYPPVKYPKPLWRHIWPKE